MRRKKKFKKAGRAKVAKGKAQKKKSGLPPWWFFILLVIAAAILFYLVYWNITNPTSQSIPVPGETPAPVEDGAAPSETIPSATPTPEKTEKSSEE
ncbi:hypothetical protein ACFLU6_14385 [Acidobacteriota bacterium]